MSPNPPIEFTLGDGQTHRLAPMEARHLKHLEQRVRSRKLAELRDYMPGDLDAFRELAAEEISTREVKAYAGTMAGMYDLIHVSLRESSAGITIDEVEQLVPDPRMLNEVVAAIAPRIDALDATPSDPTKAPSTASA